MNVIKNKYFFFLTRILKDFFKPVQWEIADDLKSQQLGHYYFVFSEKAMENQKGGQKSIIFDADGIPMNPTYVDVKDKDYVYFPITIGQVGLAIFHTYLNTKSDEDKKRFLNIADWFLSNGKENNNLGIRWMTDVSLPQYKNPGPWQSAFSQSRGISVLLRAYQMTNKKVYAEIAEKALMPFKISTSNGGVTSFTPFGPFYEEYTAEVPTLVLNGMIYSLCGVADFMRVFPENIPAKEIFNEGIKTLEKILPEYNMGYWSKYNLCKAEWYPKIDPATIAYQHMHTAQLNMLYNLTGIKAFKDFADLFKQQINIVNIMRMYMVKYKALKMLGRI
ncbi:MAG: hypothetical protein JW956_03855 [Calditrichaceae bacterium]|nr:hypothetical protein [Calditrichaceae bacterium]